MVKASDLRVGNLVYIPKTDQIATVCSVVEFIGVQVNKNVIFEPIPFNEIEPIELSEEWFLDFGFKKEKIKYSQKQFTYRLDYSCISYSQKRNKYESLGIKVDIKYVHQLQNLIYISTANELKRGEKIKEKAKQTQV